MQKAPAGAFCFVGRKEITHIDLMRNFKQGMSLPQF